MYGIRYRNRLLAEDTSGAPNLPRPQHKHVSHGARAHIGNWPILLPTLFITRPMDLQRECPKRKIPITSLSTELVLLIIDRIHPASHLDFACTSRQFCTYSFNVLKRHHEAFTKYRAVTLEISPAVIPTLLCSAFGYTAPISAWHVRSLEVWYDRGARTGWTQPSAQTQSDEDEVVFWQRGNLSTGRLKTIWSPWRMMKTRLSPYSD